MSESDQIINFHNMAKILKYPELPKNFKTRVCIYSNFENKVKFYLEGFQQLVQVLDIYLRLQFLTTLLIVV